MWRYSRNGILLTCVDEIDRRIEIGPSGQLRNRSAAGSSPPASVDALTTRRFFLTMQVPRTTSGVFRFEWLTTRGIGNRYQPPSIRGGHVTSGRDRQSASSHGGGVRITVSHQPRSIAAIGCPTAPQRGGSQARRNGRSDSRRIRLARVGASAVVRPTRTRASDELRSVCATGARSEPVRNALGESVRRTLEHRTTAGGTWQFVVKMTQR